MKPRLLPALDIRATRQCKLVLLKKLWPRTAAIFSLLTAGTVAAATFDVTTTADTGAGSLRDAITLANANAGLDTITFHIPGSGVHTITPLPDLPTITDPVIIDGYTQPGASPNTNPLTLGAGAIDGVTCARLRLDATPIRANNISKQILAFISLQN